MNRFKVSTEKTIKMKRYNFRVDLSQQMKNLLDIYSKKYYISKANLIRQMIQYCLNQLEE
jgi:hypothetical protein